MCQFLEHLPPMADPRICSAGTCNNGVLIPIDAELCLGEAAAR
jgi:hypothetical protein